MNRRHFLKLSVPVATLPFLPATLGGLGTTKKAHAQGNFPRRLFLIFSGCGTVESQFYPQGGETDFTFAPGSILEPIAKFKSKLIFPKGVRRLTSGSGAHEKNMGGVWTGSGLVATNGYPTSASVDQIIANKLPAGPMFKSLQFGAQCDSFNRGGNKPVLKSMTYSGRNAVLSPEDDPNVMFAKLMIAPTPSGGGVMGPSPEELTRLRDKKKSVLDAVRGDLQALMGRIDRDDRSRLEAHLTSLSAIEKRLSEPLGGQPSTVGCTAPPKPMATLADANARLDNANFPAILDIQNKLAVAALACNRTQVVSVQWSRAFSGVRHTWVGVQEDHHTLSHKTGAGDMKNQHAINRWYGERLAELLGNLDSVKEGGGSLLDNSLLVWGNEAMNGLHDASRMPGLMAGSCGGKLKTGRLLELPGNDWSQVLVSMCHAMGVTDVDKVGELPMKTGPIQALFA
jgi:hypothetical protein